MDPQSQPRDLGLGGADPSGWAPLVVPSSNPPGVNPENRIARNDNGQASSVASGSQTNLNQLSGSRELPVREKTRVNGSGGTKPPASHKTCGKCGQQLAGQFVRAIGGTFHLECFKCQVRSIRNSCDECT